MIFESINNHLKNRACILHIFLFLSFLLYFTKVPVHSGLGIANTQTNLVLCYRNLEKHFLKYLDQGLGHSRCSRNHGEDNRQLDSHQTNVSLAGLGREVLRQEVLSGGGCGAGALGQGAAPAQLGRAVGVGQGEALLSPFPEGH